MQGVGNKITRVVSKLVDVPISLGVHQLPGTYNKCTFYVLDTPGYHFILGLTLLGAVKNIVHCAT